MLDFLFKNKSPKQIVLKNTFWLSFGTIISKLIRALMVVYVARILGVEQYGLYSYGLSLASIFFIFADIGLSSLLIREYIKKPEERRAYVSTITAIKLTLIGLSIILISFVAPHISQLKETNTLLPLFAILLSLDGLRSFGFSIFRAKNKMEFETYTEIITEIISTVIGFTILLKAPSVHNLLLGYIASSTLGVSLILMYVGIKNISAFFKNIKLELVSSILKASAPYALIGIFAMLMTNIDMYLIGYFLSVEQAGIYAAALRPISILYLLPGFISTAIFPTMNQLITSKEVSKTKLLLEKSITATLAVALPIVIGGIIVGYPIMRVIFGVEYVQSANTFKLLLLTLIPIFPGFILSNILFSYEKRWAPLIATGAGAIVNIILDILLIPKYGIAGSAFATVLAQTVMNGYLYFEVNKITPFSLFSKLKKIILSCFILALSTYGMYLISVPLILLVPTSGLVYIMTLFITKESLIEDIKKSF